MFHITWIKYILEIYIYHIWAVYTPVVSALGRDKEYIYKTGHCEQASAKCG